MPKIERSQLDKTINIHKKIDPKFGGKPWSNGNRAVVKRSWVQIPTPYTGWM